MNSVFQYLFCLIFYTFCTNSSVQAWANNDIIIRGQFIVEVITNHEFHRWIHQTKADLRYRDLKVENLMESPFNLWLVSVDENSAFSASLESTIRQSRTILRYIKNKRLTTRQTPDDPLFPNQWQFENTGQNNGKIGADMDMIRAWEITTGGLTYSGDTIVVAVLDDGINGNHPDMRDNMWINHKEIPNNGIDDDGNGYIDDYFGWNVKSQDDDVYTGGGHGTPVAGIIGAVGNNREGVSGVNWKIKLLPINYGQATEARALASYGYVYKMRQLWNQTNGAQGAFIAVTNASWGIEELFSEEAQLWCQLYDALGSIGVLNIAATANKNVDVDEVGDMPSTCESEYLIIVTNVNRLDEKSLSAGGSAWGRKSVDLGAFGHQVYTVTRNSYGNFGGTSGASPHVAGLVALMYSVPCEVFDSLIYYSPDVAAIIVKDMLLLGVDSNPTLENITSSGGRVNAYNALSNLMTLCDECSPPAGVTLQASDSSVVVSWPFDSGENISLRYRKSYELSWTVVENIKSGYELKDLDFCEEYEIQWSAICGILATEFGYSKFFKTQGCCLLPTVSQIKIDSDKISFNLNHNEDALYLVTYSINNGNEIDTLISNKEFEWSQLSECQTIKFNIQSQCLKFNNSSPTSLNYIVSSPCGSCTENIFCQFGRKDNSQEWIETLQIGEFINQTKNEPNGYNHFFGFNKISLTQGLNYPFNLKVGYRSDAFTEYLKVYIDYNQNGIYELEENIISQGPNINSFTDEIKVPIDAKSGYTSMRAILSFEEFDGPCDDPVFEFGEVEDYCLFIGVPCRGSSELDTITKTSQSFTFRLLTSTENVDSIRIDIKAKDESTWDTYFMTDTLLIDNLKPCILYEYRYFNVCGTISSNIIKTDTIRTLCSNSTVDLLNNITIYPNPTKDHIMVDLGTLSMSDFSLMMRSIDGHHIDISTNISKNNQSYKIDVSSLYSGVYILTFFDGKSEIAHYRVVILRE